jgi:signal peptidase I
MAETLRGSHHEVTCADCGYSFVCAAEGSPDAFLCVCPNCGYASEKAIPLPELAGDRVLIDKTAYVFRSPQRWDVIAFSRPAHDDALVVKRVAGLPGETIEIRNGDVYADGKIQRKSLRQQRAVRIPVYDADFRPKLEPTPPARWQGKSANTGWKWDEGRLLHGESSRNSPIDWLVYRHWRRVDGGAKVVPCAITDLSAYNQRRPRREEDVHFVLDVMLSVELGEAVGPGVLWLRATDGQDVFHVAMDLQRESYTLLHNGSPVPGVKGRLPAVLRGKCVELSLFDQQLLLAIDGRTVVEWPYQRSTDPPTTCCEPVAIGSQGAGVELRHVQIYRDIFYTRPPGGFVVTPVRLSANEYFVLGDNSVISEDSRIWSKDGGVAASLLQGRPFLVIYPARDLSWGERHFQVPDLGRIRYIR